MNNVTRNINYGLDDTLRIEHERLYHTVLHIDPDIEFDSVKGMATTALAALIDFSNEI